ncbi:hypothetical protein BDN72DRAFT_864802 [Pluteus cervinus]|uniref:Uncharacterized protein n=1 Tax=Pluteus cervinus TaxID=181527 RepID=A0ACD3A2J6_9AGAR|nr:hypothetical protein BDN72DRAFT_864802 [Pluteus cervinus]
MPQMRGMTRRSQTQTTRIGLRRKWGGDNAGRMVADPDEIPGLDEEARAQRVEGREEAFNSNCFKLDVRSSKPEKVLGGFYVADLTVKSPARDAMAVQTTEKVYLKEKATLVTIPFFLALEIATLVDYMFLARPHSLLILRNVLRNMDGSLEPSRGYSMLEFGFEEKKQASYLQVSTDVSGYQDSKVQVGALLDSQSTKRGCGMERGKPSRNLPGLPNLQSALTRFLQLTIHASFRFHYRSQNENHNLEHPKFADKFRRYLIRVECQKDRVVAAFEVVNGGTKRSEPSILPLVPTRHVRPIAFALAPIHLWHESIHTNSKLIRDSFVMKKWR